MRRCALRHHMNLPIPILSVIIGAVILLFGRKLFWLCVAAVGFALGVEMAPHLVHQPTSLLALTFALILGFIGALVALFLQRLAIGMVGFLAGGRLAWGIVTAFLVNLAPYRWFTFIVGGVIGAILLLALFDWALIVLSAFVGAYLIQSVITLPQTGSAVFFVVLAAIGIFAQATAMRRRVVPPP